MAHQIEDVFNEMGVFLVFEQVLYYVRLFRTTSQIVGQGIEISDGVTGSFFIIHDDLQQMGLHEAEISLYLPLRLNAEDGNCVVCTAHGIVPVAGNRVFVDTLILNCTSLVPGVPKWINFDIMD